MKAKHTLNCTRDGIQLSQGDPWDEATGRSVLLPPFIKNRGIPENSTFLPSCRRMITLPSQQTLCTQSQLLWHLSLPDWMENFKNTLSGQVLVELVVSSSPPSAAQSTRCPKGGILCTHVWSGRIFPINSHCFFLSVLKEVFWQCSIPLATWHFCDLPSSKRMQKELQHSSSSPNNEPWWVWRNLISIPVHLRAWGNHPALLLPPCAGGKAFPRRITVWECGSFSDSGTPHSGQAHLGSLNPHLPPVPHLLPRAKSGCLGKNPGWTQQAQINAQQHLESLNILFLLPRHAQGPIHKSLGRQGVSQTTSHLQGTFWTHPTAPLRAGWRIFFSDFLFEHPAPHDFCTLKVCTAHTAGHCRDTAGT